MPLPAYILCASDGSVDDRTNLISFFRVVEAFDVVPVEIPDDPEAPKPPIRGVQMFVVAAWLREDSDGPEQSFEVEMALIAPNGEEPVFARSEPFTFDPTPNTLYRCHAPEFKIPGFPALGVFRVEARIRRVGEETWLHRQSFPFIVRQAKEGATGKPSSLLVSPDKSAISG